MLLSVARHKKAVESLIGNLAERKHFPDARLETMWPDKSAPSLYAAPSPVRSDADEMRSSHSATYR